MDTWVLIHSVKRAEFFLSNNIKYDRIKVGSGVYYEQIDKIKSRNWKYAKLVFRGEPKFQIFIYKIL